MKSIAGTIFIGIVLLLAQAFAANVDQIPGNHEDKQAIQISEDRQGTQEDKSLSSSSSCEASLKMAAIDGMEVGVVNCSMGRTCNDGQICCLVMSSHYCCDKATEKCGPGIECVNK